MVPPRNRPLRSLPGRLARRHIRTATHWGHFVVLKRLMSWPHPNPLPPWCVTPPTGYSGRRKCGTMMCACVSERYCATPPQPISHGRQALKTCNHVKHHNTMADYESCAKHDQVVQAGKKWWFPGGNQDPTICTKCLVCLLHMAYGTECRTCVDQQTQALSTCT